MLDVLKSILYSVAFPFAIIFICLLCGLIYLACDVPEGEYYEIY